MTIRLARGTLHAAYERRTHLVITGAAAVALASSLTMVAVDADAAGAQVTRAEYRDVQEGMTPSKVKRVVNSTGRVYSETSTCLMRRYSGWGDTRVWLTWHSDVDGNNFRLSGKNRLARDLTPLGCGGPI